MEGAPTCLKVCLTAKLLNKPFRKLLLAWRRHHGVAGPESNWQLWSRSQQEGEKDRQTPRRIEEDQCIGEALQRETEESCGGGALHIDVVYTGPGSASVLYLDEPSIGAGVRSWSEAQSMTPMASGGLAAAITSDVLNTLREVPLHRCMGPRSIGLPAQCNVL